MNLLVAEHVGLERERFFKREPFAGLLQLGFVAWPVDTFQCFFVRVQPHRATHVQGHGVRKRFRGQAVEHPVDHAGDR